MNATEEAIFKILFPPDGDTPLVCLDATPRMRIIVRELIDLSQGKNITPNVGRRITTPGESRAITERIVELYQSGLPWGRVAEVLGLGISVNACRKRYEDWQKAQKKVSQETETAAELPGLQEAEELQVETVLVSESMIAERIEAVAEPAEKPLEEISPATQSAEVSAASLDGDKILRLKEQGNDTKEIAAILSAELGVEVPWQAVRAKLAHMARMHKGGAAAQEISGEPFSGSPENGVAALEETAEGKPQNDNAPGAPAGQSSASSGGEPPQKAKYPDPKPISRANLEAMMLELHEQGMDPDEISEEICRRGYPRGPGTVKAWLGRLGVEV